MADAQKNPNCGFFGGKSEYCVHHWKSWKTVMAILWRVNVTAVFGSCDNILVLGSWYIVYDCTLFFITVVSFRHILLWTCILWHNTLCVECLVYDLLFVVIWNSVLKITFAYTVITKLPQSIYSTLKDEDPSSECHEWLGFSLMPRTFFTT